MKPQQTTQNEVTADSEPESETVAVEVWGDYYEVEQSLLEDEYYVWNSAKSASNNLPEQSHIQHVRNGVDFLITLYESISGDTPFLTEDTLRRACACFVAHDYHKRRGEIEGYDEQFDVTIEDASDFIDSSDLHTLADSISVQELRGVMAAHHISSDAALHDSVPQSVFDAYHLVLVADAVASNSNVTDMPLDSVQERLTSALGNHQFTLHKHSIQCDSTAMSGIVNDAVSEVLQETDGWVVLRQYADGCLYLSSDTESPTGDGYLDEIYDEFHDQLRSGHIAYADDTVESGGIELRSSVNRFYDVSHRDIYYQGVINAAVGVMQKAITDASNSRDFPKDERDCIERNIAPHIETDIHMDTRRVSGLARGVETLYISFMQFFTDQTADAEWESNELWGMMKLFELETPERREELKALTEANSEKLVGANQWLYKYVIAQYIYEDYYDGRDATELKKSFRKLFEANLPRFNGFSSYEDEIGVSKIHNEVALAITRGLAVDGERLTSDRSDRLDTLSEYETGECAYCGTDTTAESDGDGYGDGFYLLKEPPEIQMKTESGVAELDEETTLCYECQLEIATRQSHDADWADASEDTVFVQFQSEYGYVPFSWRMEEVLRYQSYNPRTLTPTPTEHADSVLNESTPLEPWAEPSYLTRREWTNHDRGFHPNERFCGAPIALADLADMDALYEAIAGTVINAVYSGLSVHFTKYPMQNVDSHSNEIVSFSDELADELLLFGDDTTLNDSKELVEEALTIVELSKEVGLSDPHSTFNLFVENTYAPGSRFLRFAVEHDVTISQTNAASAVRLDNKFGATLPAAERMAQAFESLDYAAEQARKLVSKHLRQSVRGEHVSDASADAGIDSNLPYHEAAAHQYSMEIDRVGERDDLKSAAASITDTIYSRLMWQRD